VPSAPPDPRGFFSALIADGRPLISLTGISLILAGAFAIFQSATGHFLPQDVQYLGMTAHDLCQLDQCRIVHFMFHDRVSFGGSIIAVGSLYLWLAEFPLKSKESWAWWTLLLSGIIGFGSFLTYLGYGYLDTWHAAATLPLLACFALGLYRSHALFPGPAPIRALLQPAARHPITTSQRLGRALLLFTALALIAGGLTIMLVGMTRVFVPQDLQFMDLSPANLRAINPHLVPLIAHDRAGFGGGLCCTGLTVFLCVWCGTPSRSLWQVLAVAGSSGFGTAIGIHPIVGYVSASHIAPAVIVAVLFLIGLALSFRSMLGRAATPIGTPAALSNDPR
jgi:hypothetical protein